MQRTTKYFTFNNNKSACLLAKQSSNQHSDITNCKSKIKSCKEIKHYSFFFLSVCITIYFLICITLGFSGVVGLPMVVNQLIKIINNKNSNLWFIFVFLWNLIILNVQYFFILIERSSVFYVYRLLIKIIYIIMLILLFSPLIMSVIIAPKIIYFIIWLPTVFLLITFHTLRVIFM